MLEVDGLLARCSIRELKKRERASGGLVLVLGIGLVRGWKIDGAAAGVEGYGHHCFARLCRHLHQLLLKVHVHLWHAVGFHGPEKPPRLGVFLPSFLPPSQPWDIVQDPIVAVRDEIIQYRSITGFEGTCTGVLNRVADKFGESWSHSKIGIFLGRNFSCDCTFSEL